MKHKPYKRNRRNTYQYQEEESLTKYEQEIIENEEWENKYWRKQFLNQQDPLLEETWKLEQEKYLEEEDE